ncbi:MAG TPA: ABC transporter permease [Dehalococcoidales bacterium]|nr:ABC transporter permease [Dehalococcoidales bacterium]
MRRLFEPLKTAWTSVVTHKLRSFLTILGVVIGIASVILLMSVGKGTEASILENISGLGANIITVRGGSTTVGGIRGGVGSANTLTYQDAQAIEAQVSDILGVAPTSSSGMQVIAGSQNMFVMVTGITPSYLEIYNISIKSGEAFTHYELDRKSKVALIGPTISDTLFAGDDPVGKKIRMGNNIYTVVGILESKGESFTSSDNMVMIPLTTLLGTMARSVTSSGEHLVSSIIIKAAEANVIESVKEQVTFLLADRHKIPIGGTNDFSLSSTDEITASIQSSMQTLTLLLGAIAGISLLVGGIGVMNIMLVSVMERRREIGIRKALGAKERDIWGQFLLDSALLTFTGGIIGVALGWGGSYLVNRSGLVTTLVTTDIVILAVTVSVAIGLFFGFYPAWQGSRLDPIQALRSE